MVSLELSASGAIFTICTFLRGVSSYVQRSQSPYNAFPALTADNVLIQRERRRGSIVRRVNIQFPSKEKAGQFKELAAGNLISVVSVNSCSPDGSRVVAEVFSQPMTLQDDFTVPSLGTRCLVDQLHGQVISCDI